MKLIRSRKEAKALGLTRYFTGQPCKHGHVAERDYINGTCVECTLGWKRRNAERVLQYAKDWYWENRERSLETKKKYFKTENGKVAAKRTRDKNKEKRNADTRRWRENNPEKQKRSQENWRRNNLIHFRKYMAATWHKNKHDHQFKLKLYLRTRASRAIKRGQKGGSFVRDLGCSIAELKAYIESKFKEVMSWENWGAVWHLDHIKPLASFDLTNRNDFLVACHFSNLQPLTIKEHREKSARENRVMKMKTEPQRNALRR